jgi:ComF family protein
MGKKISPGGNFLPMPAAMAMGWARWIRVLEAGLFPPRCTHCGEWMPTGTGFPDRRPAHRMALSSPLAAALSRALCGDCLRDDLRAIEAPFCSVCGIPFESRIGDSHPCGRCLEAPGPIGKLRSAGIHRGALSSVIHDLKYNRRIRLGRRLGTVLFDLLTTHWSRQELDLVIPVPLHPLRCRQRGFNQSLLMVRPWPRLAAERAPEWMDFAQSAGVLVRHQNTRQQTGLDRQKRRANVRGAFSIHSDTAVRGKHVLLVDDVLTTGATMDACARVLLKAGAASVDGLTVARAL